MSYLDQFRKECSKNMADHFECFKQPISIVYELKQDCPNCYYDYSANRSTGLYRPGGPKPFPRGAVCPVCRGDGKLPATQNTEQIPVLVEWNANKFDLALPTDVKIVVPKGFMQITCLISDAIKVKQSQRFIYGGQAFTLAGEPTDTYRITPGEYNVAILKREGI